jgi:hypothetical protein
MLPLRFSRPLLALLAVPLFAACGYGDHSSHTGQYGSYSPNTSTPQTTIEQAAIDTDQTLDVSPGAGAGAFIEYASGGTYRITTSCDVAQGSNCYWDIVVTPLNNAALLSAAPIALESDDSLTFGANNQLRLVAYTGKDFDGFSFQTDPGAAIELDALLDNGDANRYLFWVGDGALHSGAPSNPIDLVPSAP